MAQLRVIAGEFGGRRLRMAAGVARPTQERVREALFSILGRVEGARVLDLFAGSGALAIEALSRGAARAVLVERDARAAAAIADNVRALGLGARARLFRSDAVRYLGSSRAAHDAPFDIVFVDPPYDSAVRIAPLLAQRLPPLLSENAVIVTESHTKAPLLLPFALLRERRYGETRLALYSGTSGTLRADGDAREEGA